MARKPHLILELTSLPKVEADVHTPSTQALFIYGFAMLKRGTAGLIMKGLNKQAYKQTLRFEFKISNNEVKYETLFFGLRLTPKL